METILYHIPAKAYATILILAGYLLKLYVKSRRFYRINKEGVSEFSNFSNKVMLTQFEKLLMLISRLLLLTGILLFGADYINHKD